MTPITLRFGDVTVAIGEGRTLTSFGDGSYLVADHHEQFGQEKIAEDLGMTVEEMNISHDLAHSLLAHWLGLKFSPTLHDVANGIPATETHYHEEDAVKSFQKFAKMKGIDILKLAQRWSDAV